MIKTPRRINPTWYGCSNAAIVSHAIEDTNRSGSLVGHPRLKPCLDALDQQPRRDNQDEYDTAHQPEKDAEGEVRCVQELWRNSCCHLFLENVHDPVAKRHHEHDSDAECHHDPQQRI